MSASTYRRFSRNRHRNSGTNTAEGFLSSESNRDPTRAACVNRMHASAFDVRRSQSLYKPGTSVETYFGPLRRGACRISGRIRGRDKEAAMGIDNRIRQCEDSYMGTPSDIQRKRFTVEEFHRMCGVGIIAESEHVELVDGELVTMSPPGPDHVRCVVLLTMALTEAVRGRALVSVQNPFTMPPLNQFEPDIVVLDSNWAEKERTLPGQPDALLVIEVSDTSLRYDSGMRIPIYARCSVPEVWIFDVVRAQVLIHRDPGAAGYRHVIVASRTESISPLQLPEVRIELAKIFR